MEVTASDLYGSGAIVSSGELTDAERALLDNTASVRDGDDVIDVQVDSEDNPDGNTEEVQLDTSKGDQEGDEDGDEEVELDPDTGLPTDEVIQKGINTQQEAIGEHAKKVADAGLDPIAIVDEYQRTGKLSSATYEGLAKAGYSQAAVDAIISGQEAQAQLFNQSIYASVGGQAGFTRVAEFARTNDPAGAKAYNDAFERGDLAACKSLLKSFQVQMGQKYGTANKGVRGGKPATTANTARVQPFGDQAEMVKAMSDKRYGRDAKYTASVEARVRAG
ncbi:putative capsid assembly protein [Ralstonia phage phiITL-1]|uniref:Putative capsid assembly protein n=1 Tax=Ralstonia phage phiITL-1 TaxID=1597967 RepID=A0A0U1ZDS5_9CAUD|nr:head assembly [Ralstonia phage phiITL-1]AJT60835.1 putative capsid assembly protein [Ralstonia phage phiITL-1]